MSLYGGLNTVYRALPEPARRWVNERAPLPVRRLRRRVVPAGAHGQAGRALQPHYYEQVVDPIMVRSADAMAASIQRELRPESLIDVGCGTGALMLSLERLGVRCTGFDQASAALEHCRARGSQRAPARHRSRPASGRARRRRGEHRGRRASSGVRLRAVRRAAHLRRARGRDVGRAAGHRRQGPRQRAANRVLGGQVRRTWLRTRRSPRRADA